MGNSQKNANISLKSELPQLQFQEVKQDEAYGEIKVFKDDVTNQLYAVKTKVFDSIDEYNECVGKLEERKLLCHENFIQILKVIQNTDKNFCTNIFKIDIVYQFYQSNLKNQIIDRINQKTTYSFEELLTFLEKMLCVLIYLQSKGIYHTDIEPSNILLDENQNIYLTEIKFLTNGLCGYKRHLIGIKEKCYLAPEIFSQLRYQRLQLEDVNYSKTDAYSLGLTCLAMGTLQNINIIYDFEKFSIKESALSQLISIIQINYNNNLDFLLFNMLHHDPGKRYDLNQSYERLKQIKSEYYNKEKKTVLVEQIQTEYILQNQNDVVEIQQPSNEVLQEKVKKQKVKQNSRSNSKSKNQSKSQSVLKSTSKSKSPMPISSFSVDIQAEEEFRNSRKYEEMAVKKEKEKKKKRILKHKANDDPHLQHKEIEINKKQLQQNINQILMQHNINKGHSRNNSNGNTSVKSDQVYKNSNNLSLDKSNVYFSEEMQQRSLKLMSKYNFSPLRQLREDLLEDEIYMPISSTVLQNKYDVQIQQQNHNQSRNNGQSNFGQNSINNSIKKKKKWRI